MESSTKQWTSEPQCKNLESIRTCDGAGQCGDVVVLIFCCHFYLVGLHMQNFNNNLCDKGCWYNPKAVNNILDEDETMDVITATSNCNTNSIRFLHLTKDLSKGTHNTFWLCTPKQWSWHELVWAKSYFNIYNVCLAPEWILFINSLNLFNCKAYFLLAHDCASAHALAAPDASTADVTVPATVFDNSLQFILKRFESVYGSGHYRHGRKWEKSAWGRERVTVVVEC